MTRLIPPSGFSKVAYLFLVLPIREGEDYEGYRKQRRAALLAYCKVAKLKARDATYIIGLAVVPKGTLKQSEELVMLDVREWTLEMQKEAENLQQEYSLLLPENIEEVNIKMSEYPDLSDSKGKQIKQRPQPDPKALNRKQRRALKSKQRRGQR